MSGALRPGTFIRLDETAAKLGVSATPVREALLKLRGEGMVQLEPHRGHVVLPLSRQDIDDIFWVQGTIARELAASAAQHITDAEIDDLEHLTDVLTMKQGLIDDRFYGPFTIYVSSDADTQLDRDYDTSANRISIRNRLLQVAGLQAIRVADQLPTANVVMKQDTSDVAVWVNGENLQTIQWDEAGGLKVHFKAMAIGVPLVKSTSAGRSGVFHMSDAG